MKRTAVLIELVSASGLFIAGVFMLYDVIAHNTTSAAWMLILGATCSALSVMLLSSAIRSVLWDRRMMAHAKYRRRLTERVS